MATIAWAQGGMQGDTEASIQGGMQGSMQHDTKGSMQGGMDCSGRRGACMQCPSSWTTWGMHAVSQLLDDVNLLGFLLGFPKLALGIL